MNTIIAIAEACKDNYVVTCNPAPSTPSSEVVVHRITETLATTGQDGTVFGFAAAGLLLLAGGVASYLLSHRKQS